MMVIVIEIQNFLQINLIENLGVSVMRQIYWKDKLKVYTHTDNQVIVMQDEFSGMVNQISLTVQELEKILKAKKELV